MHNIRSYFKLYRNIKTFATHITFKIERNGTKTKDTEVHKHIDSLPCVDTVAQDMLEQAKKNMENKSHTVNVLMEEELKQFSQQFSKEESNINNSPPHSIGDIIELRISQLGYNGQGMAMKDNWVYFVPFVSLGELVSCQVSSNHNVSTQGYSITRLINVLEASPNRAIPKCQYFTKCSGCQLQHIEYEEQLKHKQDHVKAIYTPLIDSNRDIIHPIHPSPLRYNYRTKMTPHFNRPRRNADAEFPIGFNDIDGKLIDIASCSIALPEINQRYDILRKEVASRADQYRNGATLLLRRSFPGSMVKTSNKEIATEIIMGMPFRFFAGSFFQTNPPIVDSCIKVMKNEIQKRSPFSLLLDIYCGVGVFAITLNDLFSKTIGIESDVRSVSLATMNAKINRRQNISFISTNANGLLLGHIPKNILGNDSVAILDPPRVGCSLELLEQLVQFKPRMIMYLSCYPLTQSIDIKYLLVAAGYKITGIFPFDFFPQTSHVENLVILEYQSKGNDNK